MVPVEVLTYAQSRSLGWRIRLRLACLLKLPSVSGNMEDAYKNWLEVKLSSGELQFSVQNFNH